MQPYFFPYIGYFQLIAQSDIFIFHDDVQYIKNGWVNRNRISVNGRAHWFTMPVKADSHLLPINKRFYKNDEAETKYLLNLIKSAYFAAPHFKAVFAILRDILNTKIDNVALLNQIAIEKLLQEFEIDTKILTSSGLSLDDSLKGEERVIEICKRVGAKSYLNLIGGIELYHKERFAMDAIELRFLRCSDVPMSIVEVMMFNDLAAIKRLLTRFEIIG